MIKLLLLHRTMPSDSMHYNNTVEPLNNGQVGAGAFVRYSEVSFIGRFHHNYVNLTP